MSIADKTIGKAIRSFPDYIYQKLDIASTGDEWDGQVATTGELLLGKTQNAVEIVVEVETALSLAADKSLTIEYLYGTDFANSITIYSVDGPDSTGTTAVGVGEAARFVPPAGWLESPAKIKVTRTESAGTGKLDIFPTYITR